MTNLGDFDKKPASFRNPDYGMSRLATNGGFIIQDSSYEDIGRRRQPSFLELEQPKGTTIVDMNQNGHIDVEPGKHGRIATFGLAGCVAVGVVATFPDGRHRAHVQHYDAFASRTAGGATAGIGLDEMVLSSEAVAGGYERATRVDAAIMTPGIAHIGPSDTVQSEALVTTIKDSFGDNAHVTVRAYSPQVGSDENPYTRTLVIDVPPTGAPELFPGLGRIVTK